MPGRGAACALVPWVECRWRWDACGEKAGEMVTGEGRGDWSRSQGPSGGGNAMGGPLLRSRERSREEAGQLGPGFSFSHLPCSGDQPKPAAFPAGAGEPWWDLLLGLARGPMVEDRLGLNHLTHKKDTELPLATPHIQTGSL